MIKGTNSRDQEITNAEENTVDLTIYSEDACSHCRTAKEINCENSQLSDVVKSKIRLAAIDKDEYSMIKICK